MALKLEETLIYSIFRRIFRCRKDAHRFVEVAEDDPTSMRPGYYCMDCLRYVPPGRISAFRQSSEVCDDMVENCKVD